MREKIYYGPTLFWLYMCKDDALNCIPLQKIENSVNFCQNRNNHLEAAWRQSFSDISIVLYFIFMLHIIQNHMQDIPAGKRHRCTSACPLKIKDKLYIL